MVHSNTIIHHTPTKPPAGVSSYHLLPQRHPDMVHSNTFIHHTSTEPSGMLYTPCRRMSTTARIIVRICPVTTILYSIRHNTHTISYDGRRRPAGHTSNHTILNHIQTRRPMVGQCVFPVNHINGHFTN